MPRLCSALPMACKGIITSIIGTPCSSTSGTPCAPIIGAPCSSTIGTPWSPLLLRSHPWYSVVTVGTPLSPLVLRGHPWYSMLMHRFRYSVLYLPSTHPRYSVLSPRPIISLPLLGTSSSPYCQLTPVLHPFPHAKVAIEKAVSSHIIMQDSELRRYALNCFYKVLSGTMPWEEYKTIWSMEEKWIKYLNDNWVLRTMVVSY